MSVEIKIPGSKSITNRALVLAALCKKTIILKGAAICDDTKYMIEGLKALGYLISQNEDEITIHENGKNTGSKDIIHIFTGNAGTTTRFLTALATTSHNNVLLEGDERMNERPIKDLVDALNNLGASIKSKNGCTPLQIEAKCPRGKEISIIGKSSSQYTSALMMIAPFLEGDTTIKLEQKTCSKPYIELTTEVMRAFGLTALNNNFEQIIIRGNQPKTPPPIYQIEGDASSASYMGAYAALNPNIELVLTNIYPNSIQGDIKFLQYLKLMGCNIEVSGKGIKITRKNELKSLKAIDMNETPDLVMTFAVLSMFTEGKTKIFNISNLKIKESNRLQALKNEIEKFDIEVSIGDDYIEINGNPNFQATKDITINTYNDHRIAMCFGIIQNKFPKIIIENPNCVSKSYETFWEDLKKLNNG